jgi:hypothetical protein
MNKRELSVAAVVEKIDSIRKIKKVAREPMVLEEMAVTNFPCVIVESTNEQRNNNSFGMGRAVRNSILDVVVTLNVAGANRDAQRNEFIAAIEHAVTLDTSLSGVATDTQLTLVETFPIESARPYATARLTFQIQYCYNLEDLV